MQTLPQVPDKMQQILTTTADRAAIDSDFVIRSRKLTGGRFVETLVFSWLAKCHIRNSTNRWCSRHAYHSASD